MLGDGVPNECKTVVMRQEIEVTLKMVLSVKGWDRAEVEWPSRLFWNLRESICYG